MTSSSSLLEGCVTIPFCHCERSRLSGRACLHAVVLALDNMRLLQSLPAYRRQALLRNDIVTQPLGEGGRLNIPASTKKKAGRGAQPKEDKMKKLVILNLRYQNAGEI